MTFWSKFKFCAAIEWSQQGRADRHNPPVWLVLQGQRWLVHYLVDDAMILRQHSKNPFHSILSIGAPLVRQCVGLVVNMENFIVV